MAANPEYSGHALRMYYTGTMVADATADAEGNLVVGPVEPSDVDESWIVCTTCGRLRNDADYADHGIANEWQVA